MQEINLSYSVPIHVSETFEDSNNFIIQGIAISSTVTDNQHKFLSEELELAAGSLKNRPLLKDHDNSTDSVIGRVISAEFDLDSESIVFKARINSTEQGLKIKELIKSGDLNTVSIGANVESMDEENGLLIPKGIKFKELSVVAVPADDTAEFTFRGTNFISALEEAYKSKKKPKKISNSASLEDIEINKKEEDMEKDKTVNTAFEERLDAQGKKLDAQSEVLAEVLANLKAMQESDQDEKAAKEEAEKVEAEAKAKDEDEAKEEAEKAETEAEKTKAADDEADAEDEDEDDVVDEKNKYKIVQNYKSFTIERNYR